MTDVVTAFAYTLEGNKKYHITIDFAAAENGTLEFFWDQGNPSQNVSHEVGAFYSSSGMYKSNAVGLKCILILLSRDLADSEITLTRAA